MMLAEDVVQWGEVTHNNTSPFGCSLYISLLMEEMIGTKYNIDPGSTLPTKMGLIFLILFFF